MSEVESAISSIRQANSVSDEVTFRFAGVREAGDYGGTDFQGRAWEIGTADGRSIVAGAVSG